MASVRGTPWWFTTGGAWPSPVQSDLVRCGNHRSHTGGRLERRESAQETTKCCFLEAIILLHMLHKETIDYFLAARMFVDSSTVTPTVPFSDGVWPVCRCKVYMDRSKAHGVWQRWQTAISTTYCITWTWQHGEIATQYHARHKQPYNHTIWIKINTKRKQH